MSKGKYAPRHAAPRRGRPAPSRRHMLVAIGVLVTAALTSIPGIAHASSSTVRPRSGEGMIALVTRTCGSSATWRANADANGVGGPGYVIYLGRGYAIDCAARAESGPVTTVKRWAHPLPGHSCVSGWGAARRHGPHKGVDLTASSGTAIRAAGSGKVHQVRYQRDGAGHYIVIYHGKAQYTVYMHLRSKSPLPVGRKVAAGQTIGRVGATGDASGPHLHFETHTGKLWHAANPVTFMKARGVRLCG